VIFNLTIKFEFDTQEKFINYLLIVRAINLKLFIFVIGSLKMIESKNFEQIFMK